MIVTMVDVRIVRVAMKYLSMYMTVAVGFLTKSVLVVFVVDVSVVMLQRLVPMYVRMSLGQMQPDAHPHERRGSQKRDCEVLPQNQNRNGCSNEGSHREIGACPGCTYVPQC